jgi:peroxiredoxin
LLLALVFAVAGVAKLADRVGSRQAFIDFGVPAALASPAGLLLPLAELGVAGALIPSSTARWGAVGALALLLLFIVGIGINLARGRKPECHCFGQLHSSPAGWSTLIRNGLLAGVSAYILWGGWDNPGPGLSSVASSLGALSTAQSVGLIGGLTLLGLLTGQWWFLVHLLRQNGRLLVRLETLEAMLAAGGVAAPSQNGMPAQSQQPGLPIGSQAPEFSLNGLYGETLTLDALRATQKPVLLLFTDPGCGPCTALLPEIRRWQKEHAEKLTISLISRGSLEQNRAKSTEHGLRDVLLQQEWEVAHSYEAYGTPSAVLVLPDGRIGSPLASGEEAIQNLVAQAAGAGGRAPIQLPVQPQTQGGVPCPNCGKVHPTANGHAQEPMPASPRLGEPAPPIKLQDLSGNSVDLKDFRGKRTSVLFWNPGCGFCQQMLPDLKEWECEAPENAPRLLVVSAGSEEANREMGLRSPVVLDEQFAVGRAFGAAGTPSAVIVDEGRRIASEVAVGAPAVLELIGIKRAQA